MPPDPQQTQSTDPPNPDDAEKAFWEKFGEHFKTHFDKNMNEFVEAKSKEFRKTSRNGGRATLPGIIANMMFGPEKTE